LRELLQACVLPLLQKGGLHKHGGVGLDGRDAPQAGQARVQGVRRVPRARAADSAALKDWRTWGTGGLGDWDADKTAYFFKTKKINKYKICLSYFIFIKN